MMRRRKTFSLFPVKKKTKVREHCWHLDLKSLRNLTNIIILYVWRNLQFCWGIVCGYQRIPRVEWEYKSSEPPIDWFPSNIKYMSIISRHRYCGAVQDVGLHMTSPSSSIVDEHVGCLQILYSHQTFFNQNLPRHDGPRQPVIPPQLWCFRAYFRSPITEPQKVTLDV